MNFHMHSRFSQSTHGIFQEQSLAYRRAKNSWLNRRQSALIYRQIQVMDDFEKRILNIRKTSLSENVAINSTMLDNFVQKGILKKEQTSEILVSFILYKSPLYFYLSLSNFSLSKLFVFRSWSSILQQCLIISCQRKSKLLQF